MENKSQMQLLDERIYSLKNKQTEELILVKEQFHVVYESVKPMNLIKSAFHDMTSSSDTKNGLVDSAIGLATGFLSKKLLFGSSINPIKNILGSVLQQAVSNIVANHAEGIKSKGANLILKLFNRKKDPGTKLITHEA
ncbi:MAG: hypothetical protein ABI388_03290 [Bacteroidia bacterium]